MRARHAVTRAVEVTVPALTRADTSASVSPASNSGLLVEDPIDVFGLVVCAGVALATRVAAAAAPRTETVNSRRDKGGIGGYDTPGFGIRDSGVGIRDSHIVGRDSGVGIRTGLGLRESHWERAGFRATAYLKSRIPNPESRIPVVRRFREQKAVPPRGCG